MILLATPHYRQRLFLFFHRDRKNSALVKNKYYFVKGVYPQLCTGKTMDKLFDILFPSEEDPKTISHDLLSSKALSLYHEHKYKDFFLSISDYTIQNTKQGDFFCDKNDYIKSKLQRGILWEPYFLTLIYQYAKKGSIAIDVGAHIGTLTMSMSSCVGESGLVLAFEPQRKIHEELLMNCKLNQCKNVYAFHAAVGNYQGNAYLSKEIAGNEGARYISSKETIDAVPMLPLDALSLQNVSLIKIDVENYEKQVLEGARKTIMQNRPIILIEIGGGVLKKEEEGVCPEHHAKSIAHVLQEELYYELLPLVANKDFTSGEYLAIPRTKSSHLLP
jgi:FkbM family methyltransferase